MKKEILVPLAGWMMRVVIFAAGFWLVCGLPAAAQAVYPTPYTFTTLAGKIGPGDNNVSAAGRSFSHSRAVAVDLAGNVYVASMWEHTICRVTATGEVTILAGQAGRAGSEDGVGGAARFCHPQGLAVDAAGNLFVADSGNDTIRRVTPGGVVTTVAGLARLAGAADGLGTAARFNYPDSVAVDGAGNIYVADLYNATIRKVTPAGEVSTLAGLAGSAGSVDGAGKVARFNFPSAVVVAADGTLYVADILNNAIRKVSPAGTVTTLAGKLTYVTGGRDGTEAAAQFCHPGGLAVDRAGNVYVADSGNDTIRRVTPAGVVTTLAGLAGQAGYLEGTGSSVRFSNPASLALDPTGNLLVLDASNAVIRKGTLAGLAPAPAGGVPVASFALPAQ